MLVVICGMVGSGKSTFAKENFKHVLDFDRIKSKDKQIQKAKDLLSEGKVTAYITCYPTVQESIFFESVGDISYIWINTTLDQCMTNVLARGRKRDMEDLGQIREKNKGLQSRLTVSSIPFEFIEVFETNEKW